MWWWKAAKDRDARAHSATLTCRIIPSLHRLSLQFFKNCVKIQFEWRGGCFCETGLEQIELAEFITKLISTGISS
ncbi:hypothetical protein SDJN03_05894, partial [Cucurbita argyrosperma subsp. sororia]